jgi:very-short-patch-repair endonuclease
LSVGEETLALHLKAHNIPFEREARFDPFRDWRADFLLKADSIIVEVDGGIWTGGRHTRGGKAYESDCEKANRAQLMGYRYLRYSTAQVESGMAINDILELTL